MKLLFRRAVVLMLSAFLIESIARVSPRASFAPVRSVQADESPKAPAETGAETIEECFARYTEAARKTDPSILARILTPESRRDVIQELVMIIRAAKIPDMETKLTGVFAKRGTKFALLETFPARFEPQKKMEVFKGDVPVEVFDSLSAFLKEFAPDLLAKRRKPEPREVKLTDIKIDGDAATATAMMELVIPSPKPPQGSKEKPAEKKDSPRTMTAKQPLTFQRIAGRWYIDLAHLRPPKR